MYSPLILERALGASTSFSDIISSLIIYNGCTGDGGADNRDWACWSSVFVIPSLLLRSLQEIVSTTRAAVTRVIKKLDRTVEGDICCVVIIWMRFLSEEGLTAILLARVLLLDYLSASSYSRAA